MILGKSMILESIRKGLIQVTPFSEENVGPGSIDLHIGNQFRIFKAFPGRPFHVTEEADNTTISELIQMGDDPFILLPGQTVISITQERIKLAESICGWLEGRSRFARIGLQVHITSSFVHPGFDGKMVLEMVNVSPNALAIHPGIKICQMIFAEVKGVGGYEGKFVGQETA